MAQAQTESRNSLSWQQWLAMPLIGLIAIYRYCISPFLGNNCRFYPSCSEYGQQALKEWGLIKGSWLTAKRICKCHPGHPGGCDPIPHKQNQH